MNKEELVSDLSKELSYSQDKCYLISEILESNFFISKKNKDKIINEFVNTLDIDINEAVNIYNVAIKVITEEVKNKLKHPFKRKD